MPGWEYLGRPVRDDQRYEGYGGYHEGYCGERVDWDGKWSRGVFCQ